MSRDGQDNGGPLTDHCSEDELEYQRVGRPRWSEAIISKLEKAEVGGFTEQSSAELLVEFKARARERAE